jgi:hypothetical protein
VESTKEKQTTKLYYQKITILKLVRKKRTNQSNSGKQFSTVYCKAENRKKKEKKLKKKLFSTSVQVRHTEITI